jgi:hypothetical protein
MPFKAIKIASLFILILFISSCGSSKTLVGSATLDNSITAKQLIKTIDSKKTEFKTLVGKLKIETVKGDKSQSFGVSFRMEKDKTIWISKLGIVKALVTPRRVAFYNKFDGTYFDGDFSYLSKLLGTELDFEKVQNILLGETIYTVDNKTYNISTHEKSYVLQPKEQRELFEIFFLINPLHFKVDSQQITQIKKQRILEVDYLTYQKVDKQIIPENIKVIAVEGESEMKIYLELKNVKLNQKLSFPFNIPSGYEEIKL